MWRCTEMLETINTLMALARRAGAPIFLARHIGPVGTPIGPGSPLTELAPELQLDGSEVVFESTAPALLQDRSAGPVPRWRVSGVVITGMKTQYCVDTTCRAARDMGLEAVLIADGHTCADTPQLRAEQIVAHHNATLAGAFCSVVPAHAWSFPVPAQAAHCRAGTLRPDPRHRRPCGSAPGADVPVSECRCGVWRAFSAKGYLFSCDGAGALLPCAWRPSDAIACCAPCGWWLPLLATHAEEKAGALRRAWELKRGRRRRSQARQKGKACER
jgi:nicotinamidase-related amidase